MIRIMQRQQHDSGRGVWGDCYRASLASILELPLDEVPHFMHGEPVDQTTEWGKARWQQDVKAWLAERDLEPIYVPVPGDLPTILQNFETVNPGVHYLLSGRSRGGMLHVVVGCGGSIVHDPGFNAVPGGNPFAGPMPDGFWLFCFIGRRSAGGSALMRPPPNTPDTPAGQRPDFPRSTREVLQ